MGPRVTEECGLDPAEGSPVGEFTSYLKSTDRLVRDRSEVPQPRQQLLREAQRRLNGRELVGNLQSIHLEARHIELHLICTSALSKGDFFGLYR